MFTVCPNACASQTTLDRAQTRFGFAHAGNLRGRTLEIKKNFHAFHILHFSPTNEAMPGKTARKERTSLVLAVCHDARVYIHWVVLQYADLRTTNGAWYAVTTARRTPRLLLDNCCWIGERSRGGRLVRRFVGDVWPRERRCESMLHRSVDE